MKATFSVLTQDNPGVLMKIASLIYRRGYNIASLSVAPAGTPGVSRFTIVIDGDDWALEQVRHQLAKCTEVFSVENLGAAGPFVERSLSLLKVAADTTTRPAILQIAEVFRCRVVDIGESSVIIEATGSAGKADALTAALRPYGILERAGSGSVALARGSFDEPEAEQDPNTSGPNLRRAPVIEGLETSYILYEDDE